MGLEFPGIVVLTTLLISFILTFTLLYIYVNDTDVLAIGPDVYLYILSYPDSISLL